jgi:hypothetical protein
MLLKCNATSTFLAFFCQKSERLFSDEKSSKIEAKPIPVSNLSTADAII